jgi:hypothetical protein
MSSHDKRRFESEQRGLRELERDRAKRQRKDSNSSPEVASHTATNVQAVGLSMEPGGRLGGMKNGRPPR